MLMTITRRWPALKWPLLALSAAALAGGLFLLARGA